MPDTVPGPAFFSVALWQALVATLIGVYVAARLALRADRRRHALVREESARRSRRLMRDAIKRDRAVVKRIIEILDGGSAPLQHVYPGHYLHSLLAGSFDVIKEPSIWGVLANLPPMLDHLNRRIDDFSQFELLAITRNAGDLAGRNREYLVKEIRGVATVVASQLDELLAALDGGS